MDRSVQAETRRRGELLRLASRTFAVGIERLPGPLHTPIETAYLLLRVSDYLEDSEVLRVDRKVVLLEHWGRVLNGRTDLAGFLEALGPVEEDTPDALVAAETDLVLRGLRDLPRVQHDIVAKHVADTTRGMARWAARGADFGDEADLDDYMHEVAGRVGWLLTDLFVDAFPELGRDETMRDLGRSFGLGLQTVNVIRGLHQDHHRDWLFVPRTYLQDAGLEGGDLFAPESAEGALQVLGALTAKADRHLVDALEYTTRLPRRAIGVRVFCALPLFFAVRTLALSRNNPDVFRAEVKMGRPEVERIVKATALRAWSNGWLRKQYDQLR